MFYLKYRPHSIDEVDNSRVRDVFKNYLKQKDVPHAWLFVGHKGMGKTSIARILARELCKTGDADKDEMIMRDIDNGASPDIQEINGADNTGIDDVRKLIENISFAPMIAKYRMYIIDEVHMLSTSAFNGLLKILEEPPAHAIFILATTSIDKVPSTIQSRCVKVEFGTAKPEDVVSMINRIAKAENIVVPEATKLLIANNCDRSFRDATKILEELITQDALEETKAKSYLGFRSKDDILMFLEKKDAISAIAWLQDFSTNGGDIKLLIEETIRKVHALILTHYKVEPDYPVGKHEFSLSQLAKMQKLLHEAYAVSRNSPVQSSALQLAIVEYCQAQSL